MFHSKVRMKSPRTTIDVGGVIASGRPLALDDAVSLPEFAEYRFSQPVRARLEIRRSGDGLEIAGRVSGTATAQCARCLEEVEVPIDLAVREQVSHADEGPLGENNVLSGDSLDVADLVRQAIDSTLPLTALCDERCGGLCSTCGTKRDGTCRCDRPENDNG